MHITGRSSISCINTCCNAPSEVLESAREATNRRNWKADCRLIELRTPGQNKRAACCRLANPSEQSPA
jgi:hypothetical protein